jgi:TIR domain-containing protein
VNLQENEPRPNEFQFDVFLSHSAKDKAVVRLLAERSRNDGLRMWFDEWEFKPGDSIPVKIEEGLERSRVLVLCMSAHGFGSDWAVGEGVGWATRALAAPLSQRINPTPRS